MAELTELVYPLRWRTALRSRRGGALLQRAVLVVFLSMAQARRMGGRSITPRTLTRPLDDASYWRRLLATVHPDRDGGDAELFVFLTGLKEHVEGCRAVEPLYGGETASGPRPSSAPTERREHDE